MNETIRRYIDEAVRFVPMQSLHVTARPLRVAATPVTCQVAVALLNELRVPEEPGSAYCYINVCNPRCPLAFDRNEGKWSCLPVFEEHPVWCVNWAAAQLMCQYMGARLPLEEEWERFASNNDPTRIYPWGNAEASYSLANYDEHFGGTTPVRRFPPSDLGLYDLAGNLSEWCQDRYRIADGVSSRFERAVKGGAWSKDACHLKIAESRGKWERLGTTTIGFRPVWND